jgi:NAD-dependent dihydropyrimidine dehydrogenase PreA subunit
MLCLKIISLHCILHNLLLICSISHALRFHQSHFGQRPVKICPRHGVSVFAETAKTSQRRDLASLARFSIGSLRCIVPRTSSGALRAEQGGAEGFEDPVVTINDKCLDCDVCRWMCPKTFGRSGIRAVVKRQPTTDAEQQAVLAAAIACPVGAIQTTLSIDSRLLTLFPREVMLMLAANQCDARFRYLRYFTD